MGDRQQVGSKRRLVGLAAVALMAALSAACGTANPPFLTMEGPETPALRNNIRGHFTPVIPRLQNALVLSVTLDRSAGCVNYGQDTDPSAVDLSAPQIATALPESTRSVLVLEYRRSTRENDGAGGADRYPPGTIALLRVRCTTQAGRCDAVRERIASWPGSYLNAVYGKTLALSPDGRRVAVLPDSHAFQGEGYSPRIKSDLRFRTDRQVGDLHVVDLSTREDRSVQTNVLDGEPISWAADGRRLLFVRLETSGALPPRLAEQLKGNERPPGTGLPVVETLDVVADKTEMIALGMNAIWSSDQRTLLFEAAIDRLELRDLQTQTSRTLALPGYVGRYPWIRFVGPRQVMYRAIPTAGTPEGFTGHNSPLIGPKQLVTLKIADVDTLQFATVYPDLDPRNNLGWNPNF